MEMRLAFDGYSTHQGGWAGVMLCDPYGTNIFQSFRLEFHCSDDEAEYEALVIRVISALQMKIQKLRVQGDLELVIQ